MGVDLTLLPMLSESAWGSHDVLHLERRRDLWSAVNELEQEEIPQEMFSYLGRDRQGEYQYGVLETDAYGLRVKWTTVAELLKLSGHHCVQDNFLNRAVWAYLFQLPLDWKVALYWS